MKTRFCLSAYALTSLAIASLAPSALAQAAVSNATSEQPRTPTNIAPPNPANPQAIAAPAPQLPTTEELDQMFKQTPLGKAADEARLHAQWREVSNRTVNEPDLVAARARAERARTDLEKRDLLRAYYNMYFDRVRARAGSEELKAYIDARKAEHIGLLAQNRVRPGYTPVPTPAPTSQPPAKKAPEPALPQQ